jgi:hypothetical protein
VDFYHNESQLFGLDTLKRDLTASGRILEKLLPGFDVGIYRPPVISQVQAQQVYEPVAKGERGRVALLNPRSLPLQDRAGFFDHCVEQTATDNRSLRVVAQQVIPIQA